VALGGSLTTFIKKMRFSKKKTSFLLKFYFF